MFKTNTTTHTMTMLPALPRLVRAWTAIAVVFSGARTGASTKQSVEVW